MQRSKIGFSSSTTRMRIGLWSPALAPVAPELVFDRAHARAPRRLDAVDVRRAATERALRQAEGRRGDARPPGHAERRDLRLLDVEGPHAPEEPESFGFEPGDPPAMEWRPT